MTEPILISKVLDITPTALVKSTSSTIKGLLVIALIIASGWGLYVLMVKPHINPIHTTEQKAEKIDNKNYTITPKPMLGGCVHVQINKEK